jgi:hypothetical protein
MCATMEKLRMNFESYLNAAAVLDDEGDAGDCGADDDGLEDVEEEEVD